MYSILRGTSPEGQVLMRLQLASPQSTSWLTGMRFHETEAPRVPLAVRVNPLTEGTLLLDLYQAPAVLMSRQLIGALQEVGVDNMDVYEAVIRDPRNGDVYQTHAAVNVIGAVAAADVSASRMSPLSSERLISAAFDSLAIETSRASNLLLFRLAENVGALVVHSRVRKRLEGGDFPSLTFIEPEDWFSA